MLLVYRRRLSMTIFSALTSMTSTGTVCERSQSSCVYSLAYTAGLGATDCTQKK